jgi:AcrR family transcriptional regulator
MLDETTTKGRMLAAALACAGRKSWADVSLLDVAEAAGTSLGELRHSFGSKTDIIAALVRAVDDEVLKRAPKRNEGESVRDRLFDVIMMRFDVVAPYKAALKSIAGSGPADLALAGPFLSSQHWMLQAAGIATDGPTGALKVAGLGVAYASVFRIWLEDDDPGLARTMAALDRRLRRGERTLSGIEGVAGALHRFATDAPGVLRTELRGRPKPEASPGTEAGPL